jgi:lambda family phage portal protein
VKANKRPFLYRVADAFEVLRGKARGPAGGGRRAFGAADQGRLFADWMVSRIARDEETRWTLGQIRARARALENDDPTSRQYLRLLGTNVIGADGMRLQAQVRNNDGKLNKQFNDRIEEAWCEWMWQPTRDGKQDGVTFQRLLLKTVARDGEAFVRIHRAFERNPFGIALEAIDPDLIDETYNVPLAPGENEVRLGIEVDNDGRCVAYHMFERSPYAPAAGVPRKRVRVPASDIIHLYDPERVGQTRGVSWMVPVMVSLKMLSGYVEAELVAARIGASAMGFFQKKADAGSAGALPTNEGSFTMEANPGTFGILPDGYEVSEWNPDHPATAFGEFVKSGLRQVSTGLGVSYNALANDLEGVNYSSIRAGLLVERDMWRCVQRWWIAAFLRPVFKEFLNMALLHGALTLDSRDFRKFTKMKFVPRGWAWVDPLKDTQAGIAGIGAGLASRTALLAEQGLDIESVFEELAAEEELAEEYDVDVSTPTASAGGGGFGATSDKNDEADDEADDGEDKNGASKNGSGGARLAEAIRARLRRRP